MNIKYLLTGIVLVLVFVGFFIYQQASFTGNAVVRNQNQGGNIKIGLEDGNLAPDFSVTDIEGKLLTQDRLKGKPAMLFFTTTWCTPCQVGASNLARYDDETGGDKFNVAILFVDPNEDLSKLRQWKLEFGKTDWFIAYADGMAQTYQVQYLDTKYVLDKNGIIRWKNLQLLPYETAKQVMGALI